MSQKKLKKKGENIKLFFNHHLNIFPDDFFVTKNKKLIIYKNPYNEEDAKNDKIIEGYSTGRNSTTSNFRKSLKKLSNVIKFDRIFDKNKNFEFKQKDARSKFIKSKSLSDLDDKEVDKRQNLYNSMLAKKKINNNKKYYMNIYNNNKFKNPNIESNELFKISTLKYKNKLNNNYSNLRMKKYIQTEISKENIVQNYSKPTIPIFIQGKLENMYPKKLQKNLKINNSSEIGFKYPKIKQHIRNTNYMLTEVEKKEKINKNNNKLNKRPLTSNKQNIKTKIKNTIDNIFVELSKNCEENPDLLDKFNSLIRDVKNIQKVIKHKKVSVNKNSAKL
jgi:hypothetical protein